MSFDDLYAAESQSVTEASNLLTFRPEEVVDEPFPHIIKDDVLDPEFYDILRRDFPSDRVFDQNATVGGRAGRDIYRGDPAYESLLRDSRAWRRLPSDNYTYPSTTTAPTPPDAHPAASVVFRLPRRRSIAEHGCAGEEVDGRVQ